MKYFKNTHTNINEKNQASFITGIETNGFNDVAFINPYVYYVPQFFTGNIPHGRILRFHVAGSAVFSAQENWSVFDAKDQIGQNVSNFWGSVVANQLLILTPQEHGIFLQYNTTLSFSDKNSYSIFDAKTMYGGICWTGGCFDGNRFAYFSPWLNASSLVRKKS